MNKLHEITKDYLKNDIPEFDSGDTVSVNVRVREGNKERVQKYEGVVVSRRVARVWMHPLQSEK